MTTKMLEEQWIAVPARLGQIDAGDAITIGIGLKDWRFPPGDAEAMRLVSEATALCRAAPAMAKALLLNGCRDPVAPEHSAWHTHDCWENKRASCSEACKATVAALTAAGVEIP